MQGQPATVAVLGGGVGGLTAAHELAERGLSVTVFEAADSLGGKSKSHAYKPTPGVSLPAEHGFRYVPGFYRHLRDTLKRIPRTTARRSPTICSLPRRRWSAADYVRTETDLTTMESANEAGRRAARAILEDVGAYALPRVWRLAESRVFEPIKRFDDRAFRLGLPHPGELERELRSELPVQTDLLPGQLFR